MHYCCVMGEEVLTGLHLFYRQKTKGFSDMPKAEGWVSDSSFLGELSPGTAQVLILHWTVQSLTLILPTFQAPTAPTQSSDSLDAAKLVLEKKRGMLC